MADAAETAAGDGDLGLQYLVYARAEREVGVADDRLGDAARAIAARGTHRRDAVDELDLADRRHLRRAVPTVHRPAFEKDRGNDVVPTTNVFEQLGQQVTPALRRVPEMMVR